MHYNKRCQLTHVNAQCKDLKYVSAICRSLYMGAGVTRRGWLSTWDRHTSLVATMSSVSMTVRAGEMSKSDGAPLGGSKRRPFGS